MCRHDDPRFVGAVSTVGGWHHEAVRSLIAVTVAASLVVAACSTPAGSPAASSSSAGPEPLPIATPVPASSGPATSGRPSPSVAVVLPHDVPDLEALLPAEAKGKTLIKFSIGPQSSTGQTGAQGIKDAVEEIGDGSGNFGVAYAGDPEGTFNLFALRIQGADPSELATAFARIALTETPGGEIEAAQLGGRDVVHVIDPISSHDVWFWADGDLLRGVEAKTVRDATELMALLQ